MANRPALPRETESQAIGHLAKRALNARAPTGWRIQALEGDADVGLDFLVQVVQDGAYETTFLLQLKGSKQRRKGVPKALSADATFYSVPLEISTLNYYIRQASSVLLAFVDLTQKEQPELCGAYYVWLDEYLDQLRAERDSLDFLGQKKKTIRVPRANVLDKEFDALLHLEKRRRRRNASERILEVIERQSEKPLDDAIAVASRLNYSKLTLPSLVAASDSPWVEVPKDSMAAHLREAAGHLARNDAVQAGASLRKASSRTKDGSDHENAELSYQYGQFYSLQAERRKALEHFGKAVRLRPESEKYKLGWIQARLAADVTEYGEHRKLLEEIHGETSSGFRLLRAKLYSLLKRSADALEELEQCEPLDRAWGRALTLFLAGDLEMSIQACDDGLKEALSRKQELNFRLIKARCLFDKGSGADPSKPDELIPFGGTPGMSTRELSLCWPELVTCWRIAAELNYPVDVELVLGASEIVGSYLGKVTEVLAYIRDFARVRSALIDVQVSVLALAQNLEDEDLATEVLSRIEDNDRPDIVVHRAHVFYRRGDRRATVDLVAGHLDRLLAAKPENLGVTLLSAADCAHHLFEEESKRRLLDAIATLPEGEDLLEIFAATTEANESPLQREKALDRLYERFKHGSRNRDLLHPLFTYLDSQREQSARRLVEVGRALQSQRNLNQEEIFHLTQAQATLRRWDEVLETVEPALDRFGPTPRLLAIKASALDGIGDTPGALRALQGIIESDDFDQISLTIYARITTRCGLRDHSKRALERLLSRAERPERQFELVRQLFVLELSADRASSRAVDYLVRMRRISDPENEAQEATWLILSLILPHSASEKVDKEQREEFQRRLVAFTNRYPESKLLRSVDLPSSGGREMLEALEKAVGRDARRMEQLEVTNRLIQSGQAAIPYALRPLLLSQVIDLPHLFDITKTASRGDRRYHLVVGAPSPRHSTPIDPRAVSPLIDDLSLLILEELGVLAAALSIFPRVWITKQTLSRLDAWKLGFPSYPFRDRVGEVFSILVAYIDRIYQPDLGLGYREAQSPEELEKLIQLCSEHPSLSFYSDDLFARRVVLGEADHARGLTTPQVLELLVAVRVLSREEATRALARLTAWSVSGLSWTDLEILRIFSFELPRAPLDVASVADCIAGSEILTGLTDYLWGPARSPQDRVNQVSQLLALMASEPALNGEYGSHEARRRIRVAQNVLAGLCVAWWRKTSILPDSTGGALQQLAQVLLRASVYCGQHDHMGGQQAAERLWSAYRSSVELIQGAAMTDEVRDRMYAIPAQFSAALSPELRESAFAALKLGLVDGTKEYELFSTAFTSALVTSEIKRARGSSCPRL